MSIYHIDLFEIEMTVKQSEDKICKKGQIMTKMQVLRHLIWMPYLFFYYYISYF